MTDRDRIIPEPEPTPIVTTSAGELLSAARISWDLTIEDVALNLNLGTDAIRAIEENDYEKLPGHTFVRGYIRSYAKLLKLDETEVLNSIELTESVPDTIVKKVPPRPYNRGMTSSRKKKAKGGWFKAFMVIVLILAGAVYGINKLDKINIEELAELMKLPMLSEKAPVDDGDSEISFPLKTDDDEKKEALIRIENE